MGAISLGAKRLVPMLLLVSLGVLSCGFSDSSTDALAKNSAACNVRAVSDLLDAGRDPNSRDEVGVSAALRAIEGSGSDAAACLETLELLVSRGADLEQLNEDKSPILMWLLIGFSDVSMLDYLQAQNVELCGEFTERWQEALGVSDLSALARSVSSERPELASAAMPIAIDCDARAG